MFLLCFAMFCHVWSVSQFFKLDWLALSDKAQELWYVYAAKIDRDYPPSAAKTLMLIFIREHPHAALEMELQHSNDTMFRYARSKNLNLLFEPPPRGRRGAAEAQLDADVAAGLDTLEQLQAEEGLK